MNWTTTTSKLQTLLQSMEVTNLSGTEIPHDKGFTHWLKLAVNVRSKRRYLFLIGNGASSSMASHFATDITKNGRVKTMVFTDSSLLSAVGNDYCFEEVYSRPLEWYASTGDMLLAISSSGKSENILKACKVARNSGLKIITLSAMDGNNPLRNKGDINFYVRADSYGLAESSHAVILHHWMDLLEEDNETYKNSIA